MVLVALALIGCEGEPGTKTGGGFIAVENSGEGDVNITAENIDVIEVRTSEQSSANVDQGTADPSEVVFGIPAGENTTISTAEIDPCEGLSVETCAARTK